MKTRTIYRHRALAFLAALSLAAFGFSVAAEAFAQQGDQKKDQKKDDPKKGEQKKGDPKKGGKGGAGGANGVLVKNEEKFKQLFQEPAAKVSQSIARVLCNDKDTALGVVITADGFILTKNSDLTGTITVKLNDGTVKDAKRVGTHEPHDLAMLKIDATGLVPITFKDSKIAEVGNWVVSPGPGLAHVAVGVVSVSARTMPATKAPPAKKDGPDNSGGYLGINLEDADKTGVKVVNVVANAPAAKAGLKVNDIILAVSGKEVEDSEALIRMVGGYKAGDKIKLKILRGEENLELDATLGTWDSAGGAGGKGQPQPKKGNNQNSMGSRLSTRKTGFPVILQHDSVVLPEDCGGPLVDLSGNVIGINICRWGRVESWAVPSEEIRPVLDDLMAGKNFPANAPKKDDAPKKKGKKLPSD